MNYDVLKDIVVTLLLSMPGIIALKSTIELNRARARDRDASVNKSAAEITSLITDAAGDIVAQYKAEINNIKTEMHAQEKIHQEEINDINRRMESMQETIIQLRKRLREYRQGVLVLIEQIKKLGETPKYTLPEDKMEGE